VAANTSAARPVVSSTSLVPNFYFPLYANSPSASLFEPIFVDKLYAGANNGWSFPKTGGGEFGAVKSDDNTGDFDIYGTSNEDSDNSEQLSADADSETKILVSLLSSGSYSTYGNLLGKIKFGSSFTLLPQSESSVHNEANVSAASDTYWITQTIEPEVEPKIDKVL
jgi:hypothetical protein